MYPESADETDLNVQSAHFAVIILCKNLVDLVRGRVNIRHGGVVVHKVNDGCDELTHIRLYVVGLFLKLRRLIAEVRGHNPVEVAVFVGGVKGGEPVRKQPESTADKDPFGVHFL